MVIIHDLKNMLELEESTTDALQNLKTRISYEIEHTPLEDVQVISSNIVVSKLSKLERNIWTPEYYIPSAQAKYVAQYLGNTATAHSFVKKMKDMIENKSVKIKGNIHQLNDTTVKILQKYYSED